MSAPLPSRQEVAGAAARLGEKVRHTPTLVLQREELRGVCRDGRDESGVPGRVVLKLELLQHTGSFKARGALNSVLCLAQGGRGVTAASGGNHGAAVAWAARQAGLVADVFVPAGSTPLKLQRIRDYGANLHLVDGHVGDALDACHEFSEQAQVPVVHPYDTAETVCGAGTLGLEVLDQAPDADLVLLACGGGGLYTGVAAAVGDDALVQPVEPELCPHLHQALVEGRRVDHPAAGVAADSLGPPRIGELGYRTAVQRGTRSVLVDEEEIATARRFLWERVRVLAEPGASVALAALMSGRVETRPGGTVVVVVSGGNNPTVP